VEMVRLRFRPGRSVDLATFTWWGEFETSHLKNL
jgi:hypothetical protein